MKGNVRPKSSQYLKRGKTELYISKHLRALASGVLIWNEKGGVWPLPFGDPKKQVPLLHDIAWCTKGAFKHCYFHFKPNSGRTPNLFSLRNQFWLNPELIFTSNPILVEPWPYFHFKPNYAITPNENMVLHGTGIYNFRAFICNFLLVTAKFHLYFTPHYGVVSFVFLLSLRHALGMNISIEKKF